MDKASSNFSFICKKSFASKLPDDVGLQGKQSDTYKLVNKLKKEVIHDSITVSKKINVEVQNDFKTLLVMNF